MKTVTIRLSDELVNDLEAASAERNVSVSEVVRECIATYGARPQKGSDTLGLISDLIGSVDGLPDDLSARTKDYLKKTGYGSSAR